MDAMKMLEQFCATAPEPTRDWLAAERAKFAAAIGVGDHVPNRRAPRFRWLLQSHTAIVVGPAIVTIAAAAALIAALVVPSGHAGTAQVQTAGYVINQTEAALSAAAAANMVVHVHTSASPEIGWGLSFGGPGGHSLTAHQTDAWYHGPEDSTVPARFEGLTEASQPVFDTGIAQTLDTVVDYPAQIWWRYAPHLTPWTPPHGSALPCNSLGVFASAMNSPPIYWPGDLRKLLACGKFTTSGTERVDGVYAIKVTQVRQDGMSTDLWVNPSGYLPVRVAVMEQDLRGGPYRSSEVKDVQWLPPTTTNLAKLTVPIPSGFVQVPAPPDKSCFDFAAEKKCLAPWNAWWAKYVAPRL